MITIDLRQAWKWILNMIIFSIARKLLNYIMIIFSDMIWVIIFIRKDIVNRTSKNIINISNGIVQIKISDVIITNVIDIRVDIIISYKNQTGTITILIITILIFIITD